MLFLITSPNNEKKYFKNDRKRFRFSCLRNIAIFFLLNTTAFIQTIHRATKLFLLSFKLPNSWMLAKQNKTGITQFVKNHFVEIPKDDKK
jgi:hypothetical protein